MKRHPWLPSWRFAHASLKLELKSSLAQGLGFKVLGFRVEGLGFNIQGLGLKVQDLRLKVSGFVGCYQGAELHTLHLGLENEAKP